MTSCLVCSGSADAEAGQSSFGTREEHDSGGTEPSRVIALFPANLASKRSRILCQITHMVHPERTEFRQSMNAPDVHHVTEIRVRPVQVKSKLTAYQPAASALPAQWIAETRMPVPQHRSRSRRALATFYTQTQVTEEEVLVRRADGRGKSVLVASRVVPRTWVSVLVVG